MADQVYTLCLGAKGISIKNDDTGAKDLEIVYGSQATAVYEKKTLRFSLYGVSFHRKMYEPGHVQAEILIEQDITEKEDKDNVKLLSISTIEKMLLHRPVSIKVGTDTFAKNYFIHEIAPQYHKSDKKTGTRTNDNGEKETYYFYTYFIYTKLDIFSIDKMLTLQKYSRAYLGQQLFAGIMKDKLSEMPLKYQFTMGGSDDEEEIDISMPLASTRKLHHISYDLDSGTHKGWEMICPYLVQYNESPYDFIARVANRFGEALYFEDGMLCYGLPSSWDSTEIDDAESVIFQRVSEGPAVIHDNSRDYSQSPGSNKYKPDSGKYHSDMVPPEDGSNYPDDAFAKLTDEQEKAKDFDYFYNSEYSAETQYTILYKDMISRDDVGTVMWWSGEGMKAFFPVLNDILNATSLVDLLGNFLSNMTTQGINAGMKCRKIKEKWDDFFKENVVNSTDKYAVLFNTVDNDTSHWHTVDYYYDIRSKSQMLARKMVCINAGTDKYYGVKLGDIITFPHDPGQHYVVIQVDMCSKQPWTKFYHDFEDRSMLIPGTQTQRIYAVPLLETGTGSNKTYVFYPPMLSQRPFAQSGPQTAFVTDNSDPLNQGRVRVRFSWQPSATKLEKKVNDYKDLIDAYDKAKKKLDDYATYTTDKEGFVTGVTKKDDADQDDYDEAKKTFDGCNTEDYKTAKRNYEPEKIRLTMFQASTPWIRVATPMATPGGGVYFMPEVGDEVMVDFENGNMERPYVVGSLFSKNATVPSGDRVIMSKNGHTIRMSDPTNTSLLGGSLYPGLNYLTSVWGVKSEIPNFGEQPLKCLGGIELTDEWGLYSIKMSSHKRSVSIESPFGDVKINAFTGIKITAPNGNIKISGKNIDISASNRLSLTSGKNIKDGQYIWQEFWGKDKKPDTDKLQKAAGNVAANVLTSFSGLDKWLDFSLLRSLFEIAVRPVDGTLQLKSYRYLLLEAGGGDTYIKPSNYKKVDLGLRAVNFTDFQIFQDLITWYADAVDEYVGKLIPLYNAVVTEVRGVTAEQIAIPGGAAAPPAPAPMVTAPADRNALVADLYGKADEAAVDTYVGGFTYNAAPVNPITPLQKDTFNKKCKDIFKAIVPLKEHAVELNTIFDGIMPRYYDHLTTYKVWGNVPGKVFDFFKSNTSIVANSVKGFVDTGPSEFKTFINGLSTNHFDTEGAGGAIEAAKKKLKRGIAYTIISDLIIEKPFSSLTLGVDVTAPVSASPYDNDADWIQYLNALQITLNETNPFLKALLDGTVGKITNSPQNVWTWEGNIWDEAATGEILFANKQARTFRFGQGNGAQIDSYASPDDGKDVAALLESLKQLITF